jgi:dTDP-glucose 4,6-dehydratase
VAEKYILVTGGAGFIGANFVLDWLGSESAGIVNLDKLTYAGNLGNLQSVRNDPRHLFVRGDICDPGLVTGLLERHRPSAIVHFAAESHVDRSIHGPEDFVQTNVVGTFRLLEAARAYFSKLSAGDREAFRFLHVSTDEVYGSLGPGDPAFSESSPYAPNSPYSASKAASDHLARAYFHTYGLPIVTTNCSNNYGPYQFPEKLIPVVILNALAGKRLPIYGDGKQVRDWLYVNDHCSAVRLALAKGKPGEVYNVGGASEQTNITVVEQVCAILDELRPRPSGKHESLIEFVKDRPGHDRRYAIDASKITRELGWKRTESFDSGLRKTVTWYLDNQDWVAAVTSGAYRHWMNKNYVNR